MARGDGVQFGLFFEERGVVAEIDADVAVLLVGALVEERAEPGDAHQARAAHPAGRDSRVLSPCGAVRAASKARCESHLPQIPADLEFVGVVLVEQFSGLFDGRARFGAGGARRLLRRPILRP